MKDTLKNEINIPVDDVIITGDLALPEKTKGIIVFAHGSGSSRHSTRNKQVAQILNEAGFGTLLFDLLTVQEDQDYATRFDISLLTDRLVKVTDWLKSGQTTADLAIGYFGASTGAAATLRAAATLGRNIVHAVVSRGGRPDLAEQSFLAQVETPTLLIIGGLDKQVIELNEQAFVLLKGEKEIKIVPGGSHLFEEPGKLEEVGSFAVEWFNKYLVTLISS